MQKTLLFIIVFLLGCNNGTPSREKQMKEANRVNDYSGLWWMDVSPEFNSLTGIKMPVNFCMEVDMAKRIAIATISDGRKFQFSVALENENILRFSNGNLSYSAKIRESRPSETQIQYYLVFNHPERDSSGWDGYWDSEKQNFSECLESMKFETELAKRLKEHGPSGPP